MVSKKTMERIAENTVNLNFDIKSGDVVVIHAGPKSLEFAEMLSYYCSMSGAQPLITYSSSDLFLNTYRDIDSTLLTKKPKLAYSHLDVVNAEMKINDSNPFLEKKIPQWKIELRRKSIKPLKKLKENKLGNKDLKMALIGFPTKEDAKSLGISFEKLEKIFWSTIDVDFEKIAHFNKKLIKKFDNVEKVRIVGDRTDLEFSIENREFMNDCGIVDEGRTGYMNLPAGEIFIAPAENSANGEIYFDLPCMFHYGRRVEGVWFRFKDGDIVEYNIRKGSKNFEEVIENSSGKKTTIAEFGIGTNPNAKSTGGMIIVDEKILGTIHIAIGENKLYGGNNESTIHWDFFKRMGKSSMIKGDDEILMKDGKWLI